jgi:hypothetical protein
VGLFELTSLDIDRTGEGSPVMAEQFAFHQPLGNGCAVDADKRMGTAVAQVVNRLGNELFTGSGFAGDQDRAIRYGNLGKIVFQFQHGIGFADDGGTILVPIRRRGQTADKALVQLELGFNALFDVFQHHRQFEIVTGASLEGGDGKRLRTRPGEQENRQQGVMATNVVDEIQAVVILSIVAGDDDQVRLLGLNCFQRATVIRQGRHAVTHCPELLHRCRVIAGCGAYHHNRGRIDHCISPGWALR